MKINKVLIQIAITVLGCVALAGCGKKEPETTEKEVTGVVRQGYTEQSNVNVVSEMVSLINITRAYEANQKVIKSVDSVMELAVSSVGKV